MIAQLTAAETVGGQVLDPGKALATYVDVFRDDRPGGLGVGVVLLALSPWLKRWAHGVNDAAQSPNALRTLSPQSGERAG